MDLNRESCPSGLNIQYCYNNVRCIYLVAQHSIYDPLQILLFLSVKLFFKIFESDTLYFYTIPNQCVYGLMSQYPTLPLLFWHNNWLVKCYHLEIWKIHVFQSSKKIYKIRVLQIGLMKFSSKTKYSCKTD